MFNISEYLRRFSKIDAQSKESNDAIRAVLKEVCGTDDIQFKLRGGVLHIASSPTHKSLAFMKKGAILKRLSEHPNLRVIDVR